ncbi:MAG: hypothetical protein ACUVT9_02495 [Candidatus Bathycorpusculaceae bacterium]
MGETVGYILRIATKQWVNQVFDTAMYYTGARRKWKPEQTILFLHKTSVGNSFIGYGVIEGVYGLDEISEEERRECERHGWKVAIAFKYVAEFEKALPIKETALKDVNARGKFLHGLPLSKEFIEFIINQAEGSQ